VDPVIGIPKARRILAPGGLIAVWWNRARVVPGDLSEQFAAIYARYAPGLVDPGRPDQPWTSTGAAATGFRESGLFAEPEIRVYPSECRMTATEYVEYLSTLSASTEIQPEPRRAVFAAVAEAIERGGGSIPVAFQTELVRAPGSLSPDDQAPNAHGRPEKHHWPKGTARRINCDGPVSS
jgi:hypothetical protein